MKDILLPPLEPAAFLYGEDSIRFNAMLIAEQNDKISDEERERIRSTVEEILSNKLVL